MANNYKFKGVALATTNETSILTVPTGSAIIIKSIMISNNTANTPTVNLDINDSSASAEYTYIKTNALVANTSEEFLNKPLVLESGDILKATVSSTDSIHINISYLEIS